MTLQAERPAPTLPRRTPDPTRPAPRRRTLKRREAWTGLLWVQAWLIGFVLFTAGPIIAAFVLSFTDWRGYGALNWIGFDNFVEIFTRDPIFWQSMRVTAVFTLLLVPTSIVIGMAMALLLNQRLRGMNLFRTIFFLPSVLSGVAVAVLWGFVFHREYGILNAALAWFGIPAIPWLQDPDWVLPALVIMQLWGVGSSIIIYLGGLQGIPTELYEAVKLDGAGWWRTLWSVTIPMMSPVLFFQLVLGVIGTLQVFTQAYIMTKGGPDYGSYFIALNIYDRSFLELRLGYASALSVVLFIVILAVTLLIFRSVRGRVYYEGGEPEGER